MSLEIKSQMFLFFFLMTLGIYISLEAPDLKSAVSVIWQYLR